MFQTVYLINYNLNLFFINILNIQLSKKVLFIVKEHLLSASHGFSKVEAIIPNLLSFIAKIHEAMNDGNKQVDAVLYVYYTF